jgi:5-methylcytosine-specific restriction endonuclease McrA
MDKRRRARIDKRKAWKAKALEIRARDSHQCQVCKRTVFLDVHHLIGREVEEYWLEPLNLITLCKKCHKFSRELSAHKQPVYFAIWLKLNKPEQYKWVEDKYLRMACSK